MSEAQDIISKKREELNKQEESMLQELEQSASDLTQTMDKTIKNTVLIAAGLLAGYAAYKLLSDNDDAKKGKNKSKSVRSRSGSRINPLLALAAQKGISLLLNTFKNSSKDDKG